MVIRIYLKSVTLSVAKGLCTKNTRLSVAKYALSKRQGAFDTSSVMRENDIAA